MFRSRVQFAFVTFIYIIGSVHATSSSAFVDSPPRDIARPRQSVFDEPIASARISAGVPASYDAWLARQPSFPIPIPVSAVSSEKLFDLTRRQPFLPPSYSASLSSPDSRSFNSAGVPSFAEWQSASPWVVSSPSGSSFSPNSPSVPSFVQWQAMHARSPESPTVPSLAQWQAMHSPESGSPSISRFAHSKSLGSARSPIVPTLAQWQSMPVAGSPSVTKTRSPANPSVPSFAQWKKALSPSSRTSSIAAGRLSEIVKQRALTEGGMYSEGARNFMRSDIYKWLRKQSIDHLPKYRFYRNNKFVSDIFPEGRLQMMSDWTRSRFVDMHSLQNHVDEFLSMCMSIPNWPIPNPELVDFLVFLTRPYESVTEKYSLAPLCVDNITETELITVDRIQDFIKMLFENSKGPAERIIVLGIAALANHQGLNISFPERLKTNFVPNGLIYIAVMGFLHVNGDEYNAMTVLALLKGVSISEILISEWNNGNKLHYTKTDDKPLKPLFNKIYNAIEEFKGKQLIK